MRDNVLGHDGNPLTPGPELHALQTSLSGGLNELGICSENSEVFGKKDKMFTCRYLAAVNWHIGFHFKC